MSQHTNQGVQYCKILYVHVIRQRVVINIASIIPNR